MFLFLNVAIVLQHITTTCVSFTLTDRRTARQDHCEGHVGILLFLFEKKLIAMTFCSIHELPCGLD